MRKIPAKLRQELAVDPYYQVCARRNADCAGRITWEHCWTYAGKQINERWSIIPLCWRHHLGDKLNKRINQQISYNRATKEELKKYPRKKFMPTQCICVSCGSFIGGLRPGEDAKCPMYCQFCAKEDNRKKVAQEKRGIHVHSSVPRSHPQ